MRHTFIVSILVVFFLIGCNQKENKSIPDTQKKVEEKDLSQKKKESEKNLNVKVLDTIPPKDVQRKLDEYKAKLKGLNQDFPDRKYAWEEIQSIIPITAKEFSHYYGYSYLGDMDSSFFEKIDFKIFDYARSDKGDVLFLALNMAQFTDGEYAGSYSASIEDAVNSNKEKFCIMYKHLSKDSRFRLEPLYKEVCLGIERSEDDEY